MESYMKPCGCCGKDYSPGARQCPHCGDWGHFKDKLKEDNKYAWHWIVGGIFALAFVIVGLGTLAGC
jgi:hypothetical protein